MEWQSMAHDAFVFMPILQDGFPPAYVQVKEVIV